MFVPDSCEAGQLLYMQYFLKPNKSIQPVLLQSVCHRTRLTIHLYHLLSCLLLSRIYVRYY